mmetsp:Transcript_157673/g.287260  ORF Transcript_157673/g.287260 Transcript_157673/m.287260 type:complete len:206 (+) Transcript_157673:206-823(+)
MCKKQMQSHPVCDLQVIKCSDGTRKTQNTLATSSGKFRTSSSFTLCLLLRAWPPPLAHQPWVPLPLELLLLAWPPPSAPPLLAGPHLLLVPPLLAWLLPLVLLLPEVPTPKLVPRARRSWSLHSQHSWHHFQKCNQPHLDARCFSPEMIPENPLSQAQFHMMAPRNLCVSSAVHAVDDPHFAHCCPSQYQYLLWLIANPALHPVD